MKDEHTYIEAIASPSVLNPLAGYTAAATLVYLNTHLGMSRPGAFEESKIKRCTLKLHEIMSGSGGLKMSYGFLLVIGDHDADVFTGDSVQAQWLTNASYNDIEDKIRAACSNSYLNFKWLKPMTPYSLNSGAVEGKSVIDLTPILQALNKHFLTEVETCPTVRVVMLRTNQDTMDSHDVTSHGIIETRYQEVAPERRSFL